MKRLRSRRPPTTHQSGSSMYIWSLARESRTSDCRSLPSAAASLPHSSGAALRPKHRAVHKMT
eukprot:4302429-Heterocapsa_arctica.AAC.1